MQLSMASPDLKRRRFQSAFIIASLCSTAILSAPFLLAEMIGAIDYPNHLARYYILANLDKSLHLQQFYTIDYQIVPNLGLDILVLLLSKITELDVELISHFIMMTIVTTFPLSVSVLNFSYFRKISMWPLCANLVSFNYVLLYGFMNYIFSLNIAILFAAGWIIISQRRIIKIMIFNIITMIICIAHLFGLGVYALIVISYEIDLLLKNREFSLQGVLTRLASLLQFMGPIIIFLSSPTSGAVERIRWSSAYHKAIAVYSVVDLGEPFISLATGTFLAAVVGFLVWRRALSFSRPGVLAFGFMAVVFLAMPFTLLSSGFADYRLPLAMTLVFFAMTQPGHLGMPAVATIAAGAAIFALARTAFVASEWQNASQRYADLRTAFSTHIPQGARLYPILAEEDATMRFARRPPVGHFPLLAIKSNSAFVPSIFAEDVKQILGVRPEYRPLLHSGPGMRLYTEPDPLNWDTVKNYDYVVVYARSPLRRNMPSYLRPVDGALPKDLFIYSVRPYVHP
jgi:hypothetical protein